MSVIDNSLLHSSLQLTDFGKYIYIYIYNQYIVSYAYLGMDSVHKGHLFWMFVFVCFKCFCIFVNELFFSCIKFRNILIIYIL